MIKPPKPLPVATNDNTRGAAKPSPVKGKPCPICGKPATPDARPFCSKRCADVDLHRWLGGTYAIPISEGPSTLDEDPDHDGE